jgi:hypothetical protein
MTAPGARAGDAKWRCVGATKPLTLLTSPIRLDATAPTDHCKDDVGTILANLLVRMDDRESYEELYGDPC